MTYLEKLIKVKQTMLQLHIETNNSFQRFDGEIIVDILDAMIKREKDEKK